MSFPQGPSPFLQLFHNQGKIFKRYLLPVLSVLVALQINWLIAPYLSVLPLFLVFLAAIMITAWYGEFYSALGAIVLSAVISNYYFMGAIGSFTVNPAELGTIGFFILEGIVMAYAVDYLRRNDARLHRANLELEQQVNYEHQRLTEKEERLRGLVSELALTGERERQHLAAELHDYLAQLLTLARIKAKQTQQYLDRSISDSKQCVTETDELLQKSLKYVRTLMADLYPADLHQAGLPAALRSLAGQMPRHGLTVNVSLTCECLALPDDQAILLYQSVRELLMNIVKHAGVDHAVLSLEVKAGQLLITVLDTGRGFDASTIAPARTGEHFGLSSVRERMATLGGRFAVESALGQGTTITLSLPLQTSEPEVLRAASSTRRDRVRSKPAGPQNQATLPL